MRRLLPVLLSAALALIPAACRQQPEGAPKVLVIGGEPKLRDPALGPIAPTDSVLLENVAQGLVRFDPNGNIVSGLAERWNVSDDGLSYIFRIASTDWPDGKKITAEQVARLLKRELAPRSKNPLKDSLGAIDDIVAMTDRVIEIRLTAPRPNLLSLLANPAMAILRNGQGTGPFTYSSTGRGGELRLTRLIAVDDEDTKQREQLLLDGAPAMDAVQAFARGEADLLLGGTFIDLAYAQRVKLPRGSLQFDPASGLFGLVPSSSGGTLDRPEVRHLLSAAIDRDAFVAALGVPNLAPRATLLEPGLDGVPEPTAPPWFGTALADRLPTLKAEADRLFGGKEKPVIKVALPEGPGADLLFNRLVHDWAALGLTVERANGAAHADLALIDEVAPSASPAWFIRRFHCGSAPVCDAQADQLMEAARQTLVPAQRYALLAQAAARIDDAQLFLPITAPVRWALVSSRIQGFAGNRYALHTLTGLEQNPRGGE